MYLPNTATATVTALHFIYCITSTTHFPCVSGSSYVVLSVPQWWSKPVTEDMYTIPLDPWPDNDDISWLNPKEFTMQPPSKPYLAFHYFMTNRMEGMQEFREH